LSGVILTFLWRLAVTALIVVGANRVAALAGPVLASVVMALPVNAGPGFFFLAQEQPIAFIAQGALTMLASVGAVLVFCHVYGRLAPRHGPAFCLAVGVLAWLGWALPLRWLELNLPLALGWIVGGMLIGRLIGRPQPPVAAPGRLRVRWAHLLLRAGVAGFVVASVALAGGQLGPVLSGLALGFPTTFSVGIWILHRDFGGPFAAATMQAMPRSMLSFTSFAAALYLLAGPLPALPALGLAVGLSVAVAVLLALLHRR